MGARVVYVRLSGYGRRDSHGQLTALHPIVIDKTGCFAYPLEATGSRLDVVATPVFSNALIAEVQSIHRTKVIRLRTPYAFINRTDLSLRLKVRDALQHRPGQAKSPGYHAFTSAWSDAPSPWFCRCKCIQRPHHHASRA